MNRSERKLRWVIPEAPDNLIAGNELLEASIPGSLQDLKAEIDIPAFDAPTSPDPLRELIAEIGIPTFGAPTHREEAFWLLQTAAEVEHALLAQYLYALYSLKPDAGNDGLRNSLRPIAVQEMGHFITVQNLLLILGESPYWSRQDLSPQVNLDPIPFRLEPFSKSSLAKYVAAESPLLRQGDPDFDELEAIIKEAEIASMTQIHHVGLIYAHLYWLFQETDGAEGPWVNFPGDQFPPGEHVSNADLHLDNGVLGRQATLDEWSSSVDDFYVDTAEQRSEALTAIWRIAAQGEGFVNVERSHFSLFREAYRHFASLPQPPHIDVPVNPSLEDQPLGDPELENNRISNTRTRTWARLFNQRYHILLLCLHQTFSYNRSMADENSIRSSLEKWAMEEMRQGLKPIAQVLTKQPRFEGAPNGTTVVAGAPFTLVENNIDFPDGLLALWQMQKAMNDDSLQFINEMLALPNLPLTEISRLNSLKTTTVNRTGTIQTQISANGG